MFKDYGEWGSYEGVVDENGSRQGSGKMTYASGSYYEGSFVNDKFHGDKGVAMSMREGGRTESDMVSLYYAPQTAR